jgi:hypothetical protein
MIHVEGTLISVNDTISVDYVLLINLFSNIVSIFYFLAKNNLCLTLLVG